MVAQFKPSRLAPWVAAEADALEAKADSIDLAVERLDEIKGIFHEDATRRRELHSFIAILGTDAENLRNEARKMRGE